MTNDLPVLALGDLAPAFERRLAAMERDRIVERAWAKDHTAWRDDPTELADRLGWLDAAERMAGDLPVIQRFRDSVAAEGYTDVLLLGMGGSSLASEVMEATLAAHDGMTLDVLDSTHPEQIAAVEAKFDLDNTLVIVSSKSGSTVETMSLLQYFWERTGGNGSQFVAITDPGTRLEKLATEREFRATFANPPDLGGRYSALTYYGLVPAALAGVDLERLLAAAESSAGACRQSLGENPGALLGAFLGEAALAGRYKMLLHAGDGFEAMPPWIEQLVAESTGKDGMGILPVVVGAGPESLADDAVLVTNVVSSAEGVGPSAFVAGSADELGAAFFTWEFATAIAGYVLGVNPFDQPDVEAAKAASVAALSLAPGGSSEGDARAVVDGVDGGGYLAILAYLKRDAATTRMLEAFAARLSSQRGITVTVGFGPRYLHSTGQLHKGGPAGGRFLQVVDEPAGDIEVPGAGYTFGRLLRAQADGDLTALRAAGKVAARLPAGGLEAL